MATTHHAYGGHGPALMAVGWGESMVGVFLVGLRLYGASVKAGRIRWDFLWAASAILVGIVSHACFTVAILNGTGNHLKALTVPQIFASLHWIWISIFIGIVAVVLAKFAIIALLLEVQGPTAKKRNYFLWVLGFMIAASGFVQIFLSLTQCSPTNKLWNVVVPGNCDRRPAAGRFSYFQGAVAVASDIILALWPISIVWNLQTTFKVKVGFCALMAGGILPAVASIVRTVLLPGLVHSTDITWDFGTWMAWATTELWSVIILSSIPPLRPLFRRFFSTVTTTVTSRTRSAFGTYGKGTNHGTADDSKGTALRSMSRDNKIGASSNVARIATNLDDSTENLAGDQRGIVVQHEYQIESGHWHREDVEQGGKSWYEGHESS